jgi:hypothetical protein
MNVFAQAAQSASTGQWKPVKLKLPDGYMPAEFPEKRAGKLLLDPKRPDGMFIVYPKAGDGVDVLPNLLKPMVAGMFFHDEKAQVAWTETPLAAHPGIENETGTLYSASNNEMEIQLAAYTRTLGATTVVYGYYAMRHKSGKHKDDAPFIDASGKGAETFDKFWRSIKESN